MHSKPQVHLKKLAVIPKQHSALFWNRPFHQLVQDYRLPKKHILCLQDAFATRSAFLNDSSSRGVIYDRSGERVDAARHRRRAFFLANQEPISIDRKSSLAHAKHLSGSYLYLGVFFDHYGHFLLESLSRCWALSEIDQSEETRYLFHLHSKHKARLSINLEILSILGISRDQIVFITEDYTIENLLIPNQQAVLSRAMSSESRQVYKKITRTVLGDEIRESPKKIYLSRRRLSTRNRKMGNEFALEAKYLREGYEVIHPQELPLTQQIAYFANTEQWAGMQGSGLHNVLFSLNPKRMEVVGTLNRIQPACNQVYINEWLECDTVLFLANPTRVQLGNGFVKVDLIDLEEGNEAPPQHIEDRASLGIEGDSRKFLAETYRTELGVDASSLDDAMIERGINPDLACALLAHSLCKAGEYAQAVVFCEKAMRLAPNSPRYEKLYARLLQLQRKYRKAKNVLTEIRYKYPHDIASYRQLGFCHLKCGEFEAATEVLEIYLARFPKDPLARRHLMRIKRKQREEIMAGSMIAPETMVRKTRSPVGVIGHAIGRTTESLALVRKFVARLFVE